MTKAIISKDDNKSQEVEKYLNQRLTIARVELNFEKLPIWSPKPKRGTVFQPSKIIELEPEKLPDGNIIKRRVEIVPSAKYGYPTVQTQEYWYGIQYLWGNSHKQETGRIEFSRKSFIEKVLNKTYGRQTRRALDLSINQLGTTRYEFEYVFYDKEQDITHRELRKFHLIVDENLTERKRADEVIHDKCSVMLHPLIVSNLRSGYFKPILLSVVSQLKSDTARLLYRKLDSQFSYYSKYEISTERFFREHALEGSEYHKPSRRKRLLEKGIQELLGKPTSSGSLIKTYEFLKTSDGSDWKLIVRSDSVKRKEEIIEIPHSKPDSKSTSKKAKDTLRQPSSEVLKALEYFQQVFFGNTEINYSPKVLSEATKTVKEHGLEKTMFLVDYAQNKARETNYKPATFNGITRYLQEALKAQEQEQIIKQINEEKVQKIKENEQQIEYERKYESNYFDYIEDLKEKLTCQYPQEVEKFIESEAKKEEELEEAVENASDQSKQKISELQLKTFKLRGQKVLRFVKYFQGHSEIKIPDFWQWDREHNKT